MGNSCTKAPKTLDSSQSPFPANYPAVSASRASQVYPVIKSTPAASGILAQRKSPMKSAPSSQNLKVVKSTTSVTVHSVSGGRLHVPEEDISIIDLLARGAGTVKASPLGAGTADWKAPYSRTVAANTVNGSNNGLVTASLSGSSSHIQLNFHGQQALNASFRSRHPILVNPASSSAVLQTVPHTTEGQAPKLPPVDSTPCTEGATSSHSGSGSSTIHHGLSTYVEHLPAMKARKLTSSTPAVPSSEKRLHIADLSTWSVDGTLTGTPTIIGGGHGHANHHNSALPPALHGQATPSSLSTPAHLTPYSLKHIKAAPRGNSTDEPPPEAFHPDAAFFNRNAASTSRRAHKDHGRASAGLDLVPAPIALPVLSP